MSRNSFSQIWAGKVADSLIPLSIEQDDLKRAMSEWRYTGDHKEVDAWGEACELCAHRPIRWQFEIINGLNGNRLWVGSECIKRFGILAADEFGNTLDAEQSKKKLTQDRSKLIDLARKKRVVQALIELSAYDEQFDIDNFIDYLKDRGAFTPDQMSLLVWRLNEHRISHAPRDFKVVIRRSREKAQLVKMPGWKLDRLKPYLSQTQLVWLCKFAQA